ncbi:TRAP transporter small permease [Marinobacter salinexigens]|uniref:TRAP transporter small permease protein n=1 Tax=Marinobacter salinexigens TaxID=2919747 RepID=A0A5B0VEH9_9GAMM|nr:TRAP transporter small permease [Marinobacter salinexigens]
MIGAIDQQIVRLSQCLLALMVIITFVSVIGRTFFSKSVPDDLLFSEMLMVAVVFLPMGFVQSVGAHLEVTVITEHFPQKIQTVLVKLGLIIGITFFGLMTWFSAQMAWEAWELDAIAYGSALSIPEWPAKALIPLGLGWWCVRMFVQLVFRAARPKHETELTQALEATEGYTSGNTQTKNGTGV